MLCFIPATVYALKQVEISFRNEKREPLQVISDDIDQLPTPSEIRSRKFISVQEKINNKAIRLLEEKKMKINGKVIKRTKKNEQDVQIAPTKKVELRKEKQKLKRIRINKFVRRGPSLSKSATDMVTSRTIAVELFKTGRPTATTMTISLQSPTTTDAQIQGNTERINLDEICEQVKRLARNYSIRDMPKFSRNNCSLIRLYYSEASCEDVVTIVDYCFPLRAPSSALQ